MHSKGTTMTQQISPVLVTGATGNTGRAIIDALIGRGAPVRAMVRTAADSSRLPDGVPVAVADFDDPASVAAALACALGRTITFTDVSPDAFAENLQGILPPWQIQGLLEDHAHYRQGEAASVSPAVAEVTGRPARDVGQFTRDYAGAFAS